MDELPVAEVILVLKPLCDSFDQEPSPEKAEQIAKLISKMSSNTVLFKHVNILLPLTFHLQNGTFGKDDNIKLIQAMRAVLIKIRLDDLKLFFKIYRCLRSQISDKDKSLSLIEAHEELKEIAILCLRDLIKHSSTSIIEQFYTRQYAALLSHGIYLCISLARLERSISLRIYAIETVMVLLQIHDEADSHDTVLRSQIADVIMLCLPGIVKGLLDIALGHDTQNHKITMIAIRAWSRVTALVMRDIPEEESSTKTLITKDIFGTKNVKEFEAMKNILENTKRTSEWYTTACQKFKIVFQDLDILTKHSNFKVRQELSIGVSHILLNCCKNMKLCFQTLLEILMILSVDENKQVANDTRKVLKEIQEKCFLDETMKCTVEILEDNFYDLLTKMPRIIRTSGETLQLVWLNRLTGYLKFLDKQRLSVILLSSAHLRKLLLTLVSIAELDCSNVSLLEDTTTTNFDETVNCQNTESWKQFKFLFHDTTIAKFYDVLKCIGELGDSKILVDSILKMTLDLPELKKEFVLMLNTILEDCTERKLICQQVIEHYVASDFWNQPTKISDEVNLPTAQHNIVSSCLLLEGLGITAKVLQDDYQQFLLKSLYLIIEKAGSEYYLTRLIGLETLKTIAKSLKQDSIENLFQNNVDYISYHITMKLHRIDRYPRVLDVVGVVTNYSTIDFLPHLKSIVDDLLRESSANIQKRNAQSFIRVFYAFVMCVKRLSTSQDFTENNEYFKDIRNLRVSEKIINNFLEYRNAKNVSTSYENEEKVDSFEELKNNSKEYFHEFDALEETKEVEVSGSVKMVKDIMKRCLHFVPSQDFTESSLAMSTLTEGLSVLKNMENELLPIVHEIWHPLVDRFQNPNPILVNRAWQLLCCLARVAKDFIRSRTLKQILPALSSFLKKSSTESYKKDSESTYKLTQIFKLQKEILSKLGRFVKDLELLEKDTWNILSITESYLDFHQHSKLQECCVNMYKAIADYDVDLVWIKCIDIWDRHVEPVILENNHSVWYSMVENCDIKSNYRQNVFTISSYAHSKLELL